MPENTPKFKMLRGHCVPITTPDNFFEQSARKWLEEQRNIAQVVRSQREANLARIAASFELESDEFQSAREKAIELS